MMCYESSETSMYGLILRFEGYYKERGIYPLDNTTEINLDRSLMIDHMPLNIVRVHDP